MNSENIHRMSIIFVAIARNSRGEAIFIKRVNGKTCNL
jgi:hypothetical protein